MIKENLQYKRVISFSIHGKGTCALALSGSYTISIECLVRFVDNKNIFICANDHGQLFGLKNPFDAESKIKKAIENKEIKDIEFNKNTGDLNLHFDTGVFQIICNSAGYENYQVNGPDNLLTVVHGGKQ